MTALFGSKRKPFILKTREEREADIRETEQARQKAKPPVGPVKIGTKLYTAGKTGIRITLSPFIQISKLKKKSEEIKYKEIAKEVKSSKEKDKLMELHEKERKKLDDKFTVDRNGQKVIPREMSEKYETERGGLLSRQEKELSLIGKLEKKK